MGGTAKAGYMPPQKGPFKCANCTHLKSGGCDSPEVREDFKTKGLAPVEPQDVAISTIRRSLLTLSCLDGINNGY